MNILKYFFAVSLMLGLGCAKLRSSGSDNGDDDNDRDDSATQCTLGTSWSTVDTFASNSYARAKGVAEGPNGELYVVHTAKTQSSPYRSGWVVRKSSDKGATWSTIETFVPYSNTGSQEATGIASDSSGNIYLSGYTEDDSGDNLWTIRKFSSAGNSWSTVDDFKTGTGFTDALAKSVRIGKDGTVFAAGETIATSNSKRGWMIRSSSNNGTTWSTPYTYQLDSSYNSELFNLVLSPFSDSAGVILGTGGDSGTSYLWKTGGTNLLSGTSVIDSYRISGGAYAHPHAAVYLDENSILVGGLATNASSANYVSVRRSDDGGQTWNDAYSSTEYSGGYPQAMALGHDGLLYMGGYDPASLGWLIQKSAPDTLSFSVSDSFVEGVANDGEMVLDMLSASDGSMYAVGAVAAPGNQVYSIVRKLSCE